MARNTKKIKTMKNIKGIEQLRFDLIQFEQDITESISCELQRIGRTVKVDEFNFIPFREDVQGYIEAIRLDTDKSPVLDTRFNIVREKLLSGFISDNEIDHWDMVSLLGLLMDIDK